MISIYKSKNNIPFDWDKERVTFVEEIQKIESCKKVIEEFSSEPNKDFLIDMTQLTKDLEDAETKAKAALSPNPRAEQESRVLEDPVYKEIKSTSTFVSRFGDDVIIENSKFLTITKTFYSSESYKRYVSHLKVVPSDDKIKEESVKELVVQRSQVDFRLEMFNSYFSGVFFLEMYNSKLPSVNILITATLETLSQIANKESKILVKLVGEDGESKLPKNVNLISDQKPKTVFSFVIIVAFYKVTIQGRENQENKASLQNVRLRDLYNAIITELTDGFFSSHLGIKFHSRSVSIFINFFFTNQFFNMYSTAGFTLTYSAVEEDKTTMDSLYINFGSFLKDFEKELEPEVSRKSNYPRLTPPNPWEVNLMQPTDGKPFSRIIGGYYRNVYGDCTKGVVSVVMGHDHKLTIHFSEERQKFVLNSINWNQSVGKFYTMRLFDDFIVWYSVYADKRHQEWFDRHPASLLKDLQEIEKGYGNSLFEDLAFYYYKRDINNYLHNPYNSHIIIPTKEGAVIKAKGKIQKFIAFYNTMCVVRGLNILSVDINRTFKNNRILNEVFPLFDVMRIDFRGRLYSEGNFNIIIQKELRKGVILCGSTSEDGKCVPHSKFLEANPQIHLSDEFRRLMQNTPPVECEREYGYPYRIDGLQYADQEIVFILAKAVFGDKRVTSKSTAFRLLRPLFERHLNPFGRDEPPCLDREYLEFRYATDPVKYLANLPEDRKYSQSKRGTKDERGTKIFYRRGAYILIDLLKLDFIQDRGGDLRIYVKAIGYHLEKVLLSRQKDFSFSDPQMVTKIIDSFKNDENFTTVLKPSCSAVQIIAASIGDLKFLKDTNLDFTDELFENPITTGRRDFYRGFGSVLKLRLKKTIVASDTRFQILWSDSSRVDLFLKLCSDYSFLKSVSQALLYSAELDTVIEVIIDKYSLDKDTAFCFSQYIIVTFNSYTEPLRGPLIEYYDICKKEFDTKNLESVEDTKFLVEVPLGTIDMGYLKSKRSTAGFKAVFSDGQTRKQVRPRCVPPRTDAEFDTTKFEKDFTKIREAFLPNLIHSIEAFVMHQVVTRCERDKIPVSTIHDAFVVNICDAVKLREFYIEAIYDLNEAMCDIAEKRGLKGFKRLPFVDIRVTDFFFPDSYGDRQWYKYLREYIWKIMDNNFHFLKP